jgi:hypothetical protein
MQPIGAIHHDKTRLGLPRRSRTLGQKSDLHVANVATVTANASIAKRNVP